MLQSLHIENFRGFQEFDLENLGRINLLVGENNSGKTSLLEAILIFFSHGNLKTILELMRYRGEYLWSQNKIRGNRDREYAIRHLFSGHEITPGTLFLIKGTDNNNQEELSLYIDSHPMQLTLNLTDIDDDKPENLGNLDLSIKYNQNHPNNPIKIPLSANNNLSTDYIGRIFRTPSFETVINTQLITPFSLEVADLTQLFDNIVLSPNEQLIIEALQIIEPKIERIASVGQEKYNTNSKTYGERGGFVIKFSDQKHPVPIGSLVESNFINCQKTQHTSFCYNP